MACSGLHTTVLSRILSKLYFKESIRFLYNVRRLPKPKNMRRFTKILVPTSLAIVLLATFLGPVQAATYPASNNCISFYGKTFTVTETIQTPPDTQYPILYQAAWHYPKNFNGGCGPQGAGGANIQQAYLKIWNDYGQYNYNTCSDNSGNCYVNGVGMINSDGHTVSNGHTQTWYHVQGQASYFGTCGFFCFWSPTVYLQADVYVGN